MGVENYTLGKGELLFAPFLPGTQTATGFDDLGNVPELTLTREVERLDHFSSRTGIRQKDQSIIVETSMTGSFTADEVRFENIAYFLGATASTLTVSSSTGVISNFADVILGRRYQLGVTGGTPDGARNVTAVVITSVSPSVTYVLNTDYTLDAELGIITLLTGGTLADGIDLIATFNISASTRRNVLSAETEIEGTLKFISRAPVGNKLDWLLPWVKLTPNGDLNLISEEWMTIPFNIEVLKRSDRAIAYAGGRPVA